MQSKKFTLSIIILGIGLVLAIVAHSVFNIKKEPVITEKEFPFSVTFELDGKIQTVESVFKASFVPGMRDSYDFFITRCYKGVFTDERIKSIYGERTLYERVATYEIVIDQHTGRTLAVRMPLDPGYLMGDPLYANSSSKTDEPELVAYKNGQMDSTNLLFFAARLIEWDLPEPIENTFKFSGIDVLSPKSIFSMMIAAYLTLFAVIIFVRKDKDLVPARRDETTVVINIFLSAFTPLFAGILFVVVGWAYDAGIICQTYCSIPALTIFCTALSICLRRKGFSKSGLIVQFVGPALTIIITGIALLVAFCYG